LPLCAGWGLKQPIQLRTSSFIGSRPSCPRQCAGRLHRHGSYFRYASASGAERLEVQRYLCAECGLTVSVLPAQALPYRPLQVWRVESFLDCQAGTGTGPDPPPGQLEAGCLRRAWTRFQTRVYTLKEAFGLLIESVITTPEHLWKQMRQAKGSLGSILAWLAQTRNISLLGDYRCLRLPERTAD
jgi:hypothetical protein